MVGFFASSEQTGISLSIHSLTITLDTEFLVLIAHSLIKSHELLPNLYYKANSE